MKFLKYLLSSLVQNPILKTISAWLLAASLLLAFFGIGEKGGSLLILPLFCLFFILLTLLWQRWPHPARTASCAVLLFGCLALMQSGSVCLFLVLALMFALALRHAALTGRALPERPCAAWWIAAAVLLFAHVPLVITVLRYENYRAPNFDFGIFCNLYHHMKTGLLPLVSCERDRLLSHFAVHLSPALYLLLPVYAIFPSPVTIAVCQIAAVYSGAIPLLRMARRHGLRLRSRLLLAIVFGASTALAGSCLYDFHENCLLVPLLLWLFDCAERKASVPMFACAVLTLLVKEDACVYVAVFALWLMAGQRRWREGGALLILSIVYFLLACGHLKANGLGLMSSRYDAMIPEGGSLLSIARTVLCNPAYTAQTLLTVPDGGAEKLLYLLELLVPLAFLPLLPRKPANLLLLLPLCLNLLTNYVYQYDIFYQYHFGIAAFLLYASLHTLSGLTPLRQRFSLALAAGLSLLLFSALILPKYGTQIDLARRNHAAYAQMDALLEEIPADASVTASSFFVPHLAQRDEVYELQYHDAVDTDYLALDIHGNHRAAAEAALPAYLSAGYTLVAELDGWLQIYRAP